VVIPRIDGEYPGERHGPSESRNLRVAETEKYAHVTYFFNGGVEQPFPGKTESWCNLRKVATYDLKPEMSAAGIAQAVVKAWKTELLMS